jgi:hypothetical protein
MEARELKIKNGLVVYSKAANSIVLDVQGENGQLFSVEDDLSGLLMYVADISGDRILEVYDTGQVVIFGRLKITSLPTSSAGLVAGDIWNDGGTLKIV